MFGFLRRHQPRNVILATLYWVVIVAAGLAILFAVFWQLDNFLPGGGMF